MIIDSHVHLWLRDHLPDAMVRMYLEPLAALEGLMDWDVQTETVWPEYTVDAEKVLEALDDGGVDKAVVLPIDFNLVEKARLDVYEYNTWAFETCASAPDRLIPFIGVDPQRGDQALDILDHFVKKFDAKGVKLYPSTGWYPNEGRVRRFMDRVDELGLVVITHAGAAWGSLEEKYSEPSFWTEVLQRYPNTNIVLAHLGGRWRQQAYQMCKEYPNCYTDCSALQGWLPSDPETAISRLKELAATIPDKVSFGSDFPLFELSYTTPMWAHFVKTQPWADDESKEKLLGGNMRRVLGI
ncbi:MAG: amidohydrolase family protein [Methanomassiliicoccales archaeon]